MRKFLIVAGLLALCAAPPQAAQAGTAGAVSPAAVALDRAFLVGSWTDDNDCGNAIAFIRDGRFIAPNGGTGVWNLSGSRLTLTGTTTTTVRLVPIDRDTITVIHRDGSLGRSTRCAAPKAEDAPVRSDVS